MTPRRLIALVLTGSLLHLSSTRADAACAKHGEHTTSTARAHHVTAVAGDHDHGDSASAAKDERCDTPTVPECCQALATCAMTFGSHGVTRVALTSTAHACVVAAVERAPLSRVATPEPPPPRL